MTLLRILELFWLFKEKIQDIFTICLNTASCRAERGYFKK